MLYKAAGHGRDGHDWKVMAEDESGRTVCLCSDHGDALLIAEALNARDRSYKVLARQFVADVDNGEAKMAAHWKALCEGNKLTEAESFDVWEFIQRELKT